MKREQREDQFRGAVRQVRRSLAEQFGCYDEVYAALDERLAEMADAELSAAVHQAVEFTPKKAFQNDVRRWLLEALAPTLKEAESKVRAIDQQALQDEVERLDRVLEALEQFELEVASGYFPRQWHRRAFESRRQRARDPLVPWRGADVILTEQPIPGYRGGSTVVVSPHAYALAALFKRLRDGRPSVLDHMNKYAFYGSMAEGVNELLKREGAAEEQATLLAALAAARALLADWRASLLGGSVA